MSEKFKYRSARYESLTNLSGVRNLWGNLLLDYLPAVKTDSTKNHCEGSRERVRNIVRAYVLASISYVDNLDKKITEEIFEKSNLSVISKIVHEIPNLTPNGALYPKRELMFLYNQLVIEIRDFLGADFFNEFALIAAPTVRLKTSIVPEWVQARSTYTGIPHSDAWVGHHGDGVISLIALGDSERIGVEFYEPINPSDKYLSNLGTFSEGESTYESKRLLASMDTERVFVFDHAILHGTFITPGEPCIRVSIDMAYTLRSDSKSSGILNPDYERFDYLPVENWGEMGRTSILCVADSIRDVTPGEINSSSRNSSFAPSKIVYFKN